LWRPLTGRRLSGIQPNGDIRMQCKEMCRMWMIALVAGEEPFGSRPNGVTSPAGAWDQ